MKKSLLLFGLIFLFLAVPVIALNQSQIARSTNLKIIATRYEPTPAEPGKYMDLWVKVENFGTEMCNDVTVELEPLYPFSLDPTEEAVRSIGKLGSYEKFTLKYTVKVDENAPEGVNKLKLRTQACSACYWKIEEFNITVQSAIMALSVEKVTSDPTEIAPGKVAQVELKLKNMANSTLRKIIVNLNISSPETPFAPVNTTSEKNINSIAKGKTQAVTFDIMALPDAEPGVYKTQLKINFSDMSGNSYMKDDIISLIINAKPELNVDIGESDIFKKGTTGEVVIDLVNSGPTDVKFMNVELLPSDYYTIIPPNKVYVGNIDPDDYDTAEFKIHIEKIIEGYVPLSLSLKYKDAINRDYTDEIILDLKTYTTQEARGLGIESGSSLGNYAFWIILLILIFILYKKRQKVKEYASRLL